MARFWARAQCADWRRGAYSFSIYLYNQVFAGISQLEDVKCSGNWMWAGKTGAEGAALVVACDAVCGAMRTLGVAVDGGKDSLSMCAHVAGRTGEFIPNVY